MKRAYMLAAMKEAGRKIRTLRKQIGVRGATIRRLEAAVQSTRPETLEKIAAVLGCDIGEIDPTRAGLTAAQAQIDLLRAQNAEYAAVICEQTRHILQLKATISALGTMSRHAETLVRLNGENT
jgi:DNA-binding Xre family transcriptional regulator